MASYSLENSIVLFEPEGIYLSGFASEFFLGSTGLGFCSFFGEIMNSFYKGSDYLILPASYFVGLGFCSASCLVYFYCR